MFFSKLTLPSFKGYHLYHSISLLVSPRSLSSSGLFTVKSFFVVLSNHFDPIPFLPTNFVWKSHVPLNVKSFV